MLSLLDGPSQHTASKVPNKYITIPTLSRHHPGHTLAAPRHAAAMQDESATLLACSPLHQWTVHTWTASTALSTSSGRSGHGSGILSWLGTTARKYLSSTLCLAASGLNPPATPSASLSTLAWPSSSSWLKGTCRVQQQALETDRICRQGALQRISARGRRLANGREANGCC